MKLTPIPVHVVILGAFLFAGLACKPTPPPTAPAPTAEDVRIGRHAMPISEISFMLRAGTSQTALIADVKRRHIPEKISAELELDLKDNGAGPGLIAALKDSKNVLSENQRRVFDMRKEGQIAPPGHRWQQSGAIEQPTTEREEHQRLKDLHQENLRNIERNKAAQAARDRDQKNSRYQYDGKNDGGIHGRYF